MGGSAPADRRAFVGALKRRSGFADAHGGMDLPAAQGIRIPTATWVAARTRSWARSIDVPTTVAVSTAVVLGLFVRLVHVLRADFPLNDGGLFYVMMRDLQRAHFALPAYTSYNGGQIPFAYPPLPFYVGAALSDLLHVSPIQVLRFLPLALNVLTIPAVCLLARAILRSKFMAIVAAFAFALLPGSFDRTIVGGGLTRALGLLFAVLALYALHQMYVTRRRRFVVTSSLLAGLATLCHPEAALFVAYSAPLLLIAYGRARRGLADSALAAAGAVLVSAPWWAASLLRYGPGPLLAAGGTGGQSPYFWLPLLTFGFTGEPFAQILAVLGLLGVLSSVAGRKLLLPAWVAVIFLVDPRAGSTFAMVPLAMLVAIGLTDVVLPRFSQLAAWLRDDTRWTEAWARERGVRLVLTAVAAMGMFGAIGASLPFTSPLHALSPQARDAMQWVRAQTPADARFLIVNASGWNDEPTIEWFPALADRVSMTTAMGREWTGTGAYQRKADQNQALQECADATARCLAEWSARTGIRFTYAYLPKGPIMGVVSRTDCCGALRESLRSSPDYSVVYDGPGATIFRRRADPPSTSAAPNGSSPLR